MNEWFLVVAAGALVLSVYAQNKKEQDDPYRLDDDFRQSSSCSQTEHEYCGYPGPLFMSLNGICECRCHAEGMET